MLFIDRGNWLVTTIEDNTVEFSTKLRNLSDRQVYDYTEQIEHGANRVMYDGFVYDVLDFGTRTTYMKEQSCFYIVAVPSTV